MDTFDALVSGAPKDQQTQMALAAMLRRQNTLGAMAQITGDRTMAPTGVSLQHGAMQGAQDISSDREHQAQLAQAVQAHQDAVAQQQAQLDQQQRLEREGFQNRKDIASILADSRRDVADIHNQKGVPEAKVPSTQLKSLENLRDSVNNVGSSLDTFKPEYAGGLSQNLMNSAAGFGIGSSGSKEAANWWQQYGRGFTLDEMHRLYGARLSPQEMDIFEKFHIKPTMTADQVRQNLSQIHQFLYNKFNDDAADYPQSPTTIGALTSRLRAPGSKPESIMGKNTQGYLAAADAASAPRPQGIPSPATAPMGGQPTAPATMFPQARTAFGGPTLDPKQSLVNNLMTGLPGIPGVQ